MANVNATKTNLPTGPSGAHGVVGVRADRVIIASTTPGLVTKTPDRPATTKHPKTP